MAQLTPPPIKYFTPIRQGLTGTSICLFQVRQLQQQNSVLKEKSVEARQDTNKIVSKDIIHLNIASLQ